MVRVTEELALSQDEVSLYHTTDPCLANLPVFVFHGPSTTTNSTLSSSRIQVHVFTAAGFHSYERITVSPNAPFYQAVNYLPRDKQGDEICRGLAFGLLKYFKELPEVAKSGLILQSTSSRGKRPGSAPVLFGEQHAADLAGSMLKVENMAEVLQDIKAALRPQYINHIDVDLVLPPGSIAPFQEPEDTLDMDDDELLDPTLKQFGHYAPLVKAFGEVAFLPTSKLRRAPSRANSLIRTKSFLKDQKMALRREMGELVDTEERYVIKMHELVNHIADDFRDKARNRTFGSFSPSEQDLQKLFPKSLDRILHLNQAFLDDIQKVMDDTEEDAMRDLEAPAGGSTGSRYGGTGRLKDPTGALAFAKVLLDWFPQFSECYQDYIRASQDFPHIITMFVKMQSSFSQRVQQTGEQRLRSAVIEPVQRLPRYSLFIDNIVNYLPALHPAMQSMLKARDIITSICSMDPPETDKSQVVTRLRNVIDAWPPTLYPQARLITAVDFEELSPPYHPGSAASASFSREGMLLLFTDCVVVLRKARECNLSSRGLLAEVDKPSALTIMASITANAGGQKKVYELVFSGWHRLSDTRFTMSDDGRTISMVSLHDLKDAGSGRERVLPAATVRNFCLQSIYEGKALKLTEEITKARIEGRFPEAEREADKWSMRSISIPGAEINLFTSIFEEGVDTLIPGRKEPAPIRIVVDQAKGTKGAPVGHYGVDIVANAIEQSDGLTYRLEVHGLNDKVFMDVIVVEHFLPTLVKRVNDLLRVQYHMRNPALSSPFISFYTKILRSINVLKEDDKSKSFRPGSPVKMLSNFLTGGFTNSASSLSNSVSANSPPKHQRTPVMGTVPSMQPPTLTRTTSNKSTHSIQDVDLRTSGRDNERPLNPLVRLEETFTGYIAALLARKGNVVGKVLRNRATADELSINAIYNTFIENPFDQRAASEVSVDVLFVAFEKYLRMAWRDQMGLVISLENLNSLQDKAMRSFPGEFADHTKHVFGDMAPQNRRAFIAIIKLLADLLDGCGNDGDRGALTMTFAEILVIEGEPQDYMNLIDRMVEDQERLFEDIGPGAITAFGTGAISTHGSISGSRSATGSVTSNASSFRRRFAETLLRQNSKSENDRPSVWRTLSKTNRNAATGEPVTAPSLSKGSLVRSRSIESGNRRSPSRDRPTLMSAFEERPASSQGGGSPSRLSTIGASPPPDEKKEEPKLRRKRRSSLSDLKTLMAAATLGPDSPLTPGGRKSLKLSGSPRTPSPTKIPVAASGSGIMDRSRSGMFRTGTLDQKENTSFSTPLRGNLTERPNNLQSTPDVVSIKDLWATGNKKHTKSNSTSTSIPTLRGRPPLMSARPTTCPTKTSPQKLRLQSPQKLRERLQNEAIAISEAEISFQNELSKIGEEMAKLNACSPPARSSDIEKFSTSISALESQLPIMIKEFTAKNDAVKADLEKSLQVSDFKVKGLDQLYKESCAENEILYEKFNKELGKIVKALKGKGREDKEELVTLQHASSEETAKVKKENARLKREVLTLRALLKGSDVNA